jgi:hypothetical protein
MFSFSHWSMRSSANSTAFLDWLMWWWIMMPLSFRKKTDEWRFQFGANAAKKQRTIQMVDPQDLPKQGNRNLALSSKPRNNNNNNRNRLGIRRWFHPPTHSFAMLFSLIVTTGRRLQPGYTSLVFLSFGSKYHPYIWHIYLEGENWVARQGMH